MSEVNDVVKALEMAGPVLPGPVGTAVAAVSTVVAVYSAVDSLLDLADGWEWPW